MLRSRDVLVLCYHAISDSWPADLALPASQFERQLTLLVNRGYRGGTFSDALRAPRSGPTLVVTFDDAYRSTLELGKPILDRLGLPATVFVPTAFPAAGAPMAWPGIDRWLGGPHEHELAPLSWTQLSALSEAGWEIGSHTITHPRLTQCSDQQLTAELAGSRDQCADAVGSPCRSLAYPYGDVDARVVAATKAAGYEAGAALPAHLRPPSGLEWPRIGAYSIDTPLRFAVKVSPALRELRALAHL